MFNKNGLTEKEVKESQKKYGTNSITGKNKNTFFNLFIETLGDPIIKILLIALAVKVIFLFRDFDYFETVGIVIAILAASLISTISEYGSNKAFERMQEESSKINIKVRREGNITEVSIDNIVVGDIIILNEGDKVAADGILIKGKLSVDESSLNGETKEVNKISISNPDNATTENRVYRGTTIYDGAGEVLITKVGMNTLYGKIAKELTDTNESSPLKIRLNNLARIISKIGYISAILIGVAYLFSKIFILNNFSIDQINQNINFHIFISYLLEAMTLSVSVLVMSVPEGLPMMITLVLSTNSKKMLKDNVLVRKMVGIETAGCINILFSDKTGTITTGNLSCESILDGNLSVYKKENELKDNTYSKILKTSMVVNNMSSYDNDKVIGGNITDRCLLSFYKPFKIDGVKIIKQIPFNSKNKYMITVIDDKKMKNLIKGAPEVLLDKCKYYYDKNGRKELFLNKSKIEDKIKNATSNGVRVIVLASSDNINATIFNDLVFVGAIFIKDPVRKEAKEGIRLVSNASIKTVMITGDNKNTAEAIAREVGLVNDSSDVIITSDELNSLSDSEVKRMLPKLKVVSRSLPQDKSRLVRLSKEMGLVTGMTGDGVNDAPALKRADVGFAFGSGSEVAKEASDIVILDNNFLSIAKAVLFGRTIFKSIRKFIIFQLTVNLCALSISIIGPFIGVETPVTVIQMLWINMVMDTLAALAFAFEPPLLEYMNEKPKKKDESIINSYMVSEIVITGIYTTLLCILFLKLSFIKDLFLNDKSFMTAFFGLFIFAGIFNCFNAHTSRINILAHLYKNKMFIIVISFIVIVQIVLMYYGGDMFRTSPLTLKEFIIMILISLSVIPVDVLRKIVSKKYGKTGSV